MRAVLGLRVTIPTFAAALPDASGKTQEENEKAGLMNRIVQPGREHV